MKRALFVTVLMTAFLSSAMAQDRDTTVQLTENNQIVKKGYNFGPFPLVAYDADKGLQLGALLNIYNFGKGDNYPNYNSKLYLEGSYFTKGSQWYIVTYDNKTLIPGVRLSSAVTFQKENAMDFYGFNGYGQYYDYEKIEAGKKGESYGYTPYYKMRRNFFLFKTDFIGHITDDLYWQAGYQLTYFGIDAIDRDNINKGKEEHEKFPEDVPTLYEEYVMNGDISLDEADGGLSSMIRAGFKYDTRDKEGAPSRGIWADAHVTLAPKFIGSKNDYYRYTLTWRHYVPIVKNDKLTFAYRVNYEGAFGSNTPFYVLPYISVMGENFDKDGMGGYRTVRGILRDRVVGLDMLSYNAEFRWRFTNFRVGRQNIALALNAFSDGAMVTRQREMATVQSLKESMHVTVGLGFRFIMNENFILCAEYGTPISNFAKGSAHYKQDGPGAFYVNTGYLF